MTRRLACLGVVLASGTIAAQQPLSELTVPPSLAHATHRDAQRARVSPHEVHDFTVDGCKITFNYGRPSKRGRPIWGSLVPWDKWWMPGADEATIITTTMDITLAGTPALKVPAGDHTLYMMPGEKASRLIVSNEVGQFHTVYHPALDLGSVELAMKTIEPIVETMTFQSDARPVGGGALKLIWDDREYVVNFDVVKKERR